MTLTILVEPTSSLFGTVAVDFSPIWWMVQQADLRFDKEAMLKMIRESWERSHQGFTIQCAQTAHTSYLILLVDLFPCLQPTLDCFLRVSVCQSIDIDLSEFHCYLYMYMYIYIYIYIYTHTHIPCSNGRTLRWVALHTIGGKHHSPRTGAAHGGCCAKCLDWGRHRVDFPHSAIKRQMMIDMIGK